MAPNPNLSLSILIFYFLKLTLLCRSVSLLFSSTGWTDQSNVKVLSMPSFLSGSVRVIFLFVFSSSIGWTDQSNEEVLSAVLSPCCPCFASKTFSCAFSRLSQLLLSPLLLLFSTFSLFFLFFFFFISTLHSLGLMASSFKYSWDCFRRWYKEDRTHMEDIPKYKAISVLLPIARTNAKFQIQWRFPARDALLNDGVLPNQIVSLTPLYIFLESSTFGMARQHQNWNSLYCKDITISFFLVRWGAKKGF